MNSGLFHSLYGTEGFQGYKVPWGERGKVGSVIGEESERFAFWFCVVDRLAVDEACRYLVEAGKGGEEVTLRSRPELGAFDMVLSYGDFLAFVELQLADWMEQVEGAAGKENELFGWRKGEAWSYR